MTDDGRVRVARDCIKVTYRIETAGDPRAMAEKIASDQSTGTFTELPGETDGVRARCAARVDGIAPLDPLDTPVDSRSGRRAAPIHRADAVIAYPARCDRHRCRRADDHRHRRRLSRSGADRHPRHGHRPAAGIGAAIPARSSASPASRRLTGVDEPADDRLDHQAGARPAAAGDGRDGARALRGRRRFHQGRREADEPRLFAARRAGRRRSCR